MAGFRREREVQIWQNLYKSGERFQSSFHLGKLVNDNDKAYSYFLESANAGNPHAMAKIAKIHKSEHNNKYLEYAMKAIEYGYTVYVNHDELVKRDDINLLFDNARRIYTTVIAKIANGKIDSHYEVEDCGAWDTRYRKVKYDGHEYLLRNIIDILVSTGKWQELFAKVDPKDGDYNFTTQTICQMVIDKNNRIPGLVIDKLQELIRSGYGPTWSYVAENSHVRQVVAESL